MILVAAMRTPHFLGLAATVTYESPICRVVVIDSIFAQNSGRLLNLGLETTLIGSYVVLLAKCNQKLTGWTIMKRGNLKLMSLDELWQLHELIVAELSLKMAAEQARLENRLRQLGSTSGNLKSERRPYPKVLPKYRNPKNRSETWAGRGKQPRWLMAQLRSGKRLDDFLIRKTSA